MNDSHPSPTPPPCERCGAPGARLGGHTLCESCYSIGNSCCPEFGEFDRWMHIQAPHDPAACGRLHRGAP